FRWASGHQHREYGLTHLGDRHLVTGAQLLLRALFADPFATLRLGTERIFVRYVGFIGAKQRGGVGLEKAGSKFLDVDPTAFIERPRATWTRRRLAYLAGIPVERLAGSRKAVEDPTNPL